MYPAASSKLTRGGARRSESLEKGSQSQSYNKRILSETSTVPWVDSWEFRAVGEALLSATELTLETTIADDKRTTHDSTDNKEYIGLSIDDALIRVDSWKSRSSRALPASVESTAALALALWRDIGTAVTRQILHSECRMIYATAIIRAINGLADPFQQNKAFASSVAQICARIGMPVWLVDVRHEATHNQMPSLFTLRTAATTLLNFLRSVYWDPMDQIGRRREEEVIGCLDDYTQALQRCSNRDPPSSNNKAEATRSQPHSSGDNGNSKEIKEYFDFGDDSSVESQDALGPNISSRLGTNANMFAVLVDSKKSKQKEKEQREALEKKKMEEREAKKQAHRPPHYFLQRIFRLKVPLGCLWHTMLRYLLVGFNGGQGCLVNSSPSGYSCNDSAFEKMRQTYKTLLTTLGKRWPGFIVALLNTITDRLIGMESGAPCSQMYQQEIYFLELWFRYLVSNAFITICGHSNASKGTKTPAPLAALQSMNYPLTCLCDRLESHPLAKATESSICKVKDLLLNVIGNNRVIEREPDCVHDTKRIKNVDNIDAPKTGHMESTKSNTSDALSLSEMEALLTAENVPADHFPTDDHPSSDPAGGARPSAWTKCNGWEPCAIGSLPGYPL